MPFKLSYILAFLNLYDFKKGKNKTNYTKSERLSINNDNLLTFL